MNDNTDFLSTPPHSTPSPSAQHHIFDYPPCWWTSISNHVINNLHTRIPLRLWFQCSFVKMTYYNATYNHRLFKKHIQCRMLKHGHCPSTWFNPGAPRTANDPLLFLSYRRHASSWLFNHHKTSNRAYSANTRLQHTLSQHWTNISCCLGHIFTDITVIY